MLRPAPAVGQRRIPLHLRRDSVAKRKGKPRKHSRRSSRKTRRRGYRKLECQLGRAVMMGARAKCLLSRIEKGTAKRKNPARQHFKEIGRADIGKYVEGFGIILKGDVGRRMYRVNGIIQVESDEQRNRRVS